MDSGGYLAIYLCITLGCLLFFILLFFGIVRLSKWKIRREILGCERVNGEVKEKVLLRCLEGCRLSRNVYLYKKKLMYEQGADYKYKRRGLHFERLCEQRIIELTEECQTMKLVSQWNFGGRICDLAMVWLDAEQNRHAILIECKHSDSSSREMRDKQVERGVQQLREYERRAINRSYSVELMVLLVDFPLRGLVPMKFKNGIMIVNFALIEELTEGMQKIKI